MVRPVRTPPDGLDEASISRTLASSWGFPVQDLSYLPVGFGSHHWLATGTSGERRFVTVDDHDQRSEGRTAGVERLRRALTSARLLRQQAGLSFVVAPLPAQDGSLLRPAGPRFAVSLYPFVDGRPWPAGPDATSQHTLGIVDLLAQLHVSTPVVRDVAGVPDVRRGLTAYDELVAVTRGDDGAWVVTHGEPKPYNVLATDDGPVLVDWDTTLLAPPARDLWIVDGDPAEVVGHYAELTGRDVSEVALRTYRLGWALAEVASYTHWLRGPHDRTPDTEIAWGGLAESLHDLSQRRR
jgi:spectinomycin phosphotransferase